MGVMGRPSVPPSDVLRPGKQQKAPPFDGRLKPLDSVWEDPNPFFTLSEHSDGSAYTGGVQYYPASRDHPIDVRNKYWLDPDQDIAPSKAYQKMYRAWEPQKYHKGVGAKEGLWNAPGQQATPERLSNVVNIDPIEELLRPPPVAWDTIDTDPIKKIEPPPSIVWEGLEHEPRPLPNYFEKYVEWKNRKVPGPKPLKSKPWTIEQWRMMNGPYRKPVAPAQEESPGAWRTAFHWVWIFEALQLVLLEFNHKGTDVMPDDRYDNPDYPLGHEPLHYVNYAATFFDGANCTGGTGYGTYGDFGCDMPCVTHPGGALSVLIEAERYTDPQSYETTYRYAPDEHNLLVDRDGPVSLAYEHGECSVEDMIGRAYIPPMDGAACMTFDKPAFSFRLAMLAECRIQLSKTPLQPPSTNFYDWTREKVTQHGHEDADGEQHPGEGISQEEQEAKGQHKKENGMMGGIWKTLEAPPPPSKTPAARG